MSISKLQMHPIVIEDVEKLNSFREQFSTDGRIDIPWGYRSNGVETLVVEKDEKIIGAVIATAAVFIDFCKDPEARGEDVYGSVLLGERTLTFMAQKNGIPVAYCAIPSHLTSYINLVKRSGYAEAFPGCTILRRALAKES
jgi:hypothetical protein